ncbi:hypothetical protein TSUD_367800 [Trifolium subterraneum]|uniref:Uncharacterized protein n=1 Tax=Trifolium subterraneum TaxID=3900 RepID=A0A2Z6LI51_TRISU|nr:hypothetical protein TSUD_367800 [Trifolium subterraneum]
MDLVFAPKPHTLILKAPSSFHFLPTKFHSLRPLSASKNLKIQCELEEKINGSLSADFDARFVDRLIVSKEEPKICSATARNGEGKLIGINCQSECLSIVHISPNKEGNPLLQI